MSLRVRISLICLLLSISAAGTAVFAQSNNALFALQRGYRTGYSDGYMAGYRDTIDSVSRNYGRHKEYASANRAFSSDYGSIEDYKDGYQQGFETGYDTGFERRSFESNLPNNLRRRGTVIADTQNMAANQQQASSSDAVRIEDPQRPQQQDQADSSSASSDSTAAYQRNPNATIIIPRDTELLLELDVDLNTEASREGDKFTGRITAPSELAGATVEGHVAKSSKPGRIKRRSELLLSFDRIVLSDTRWSNFSAQLMEVMPVKGDNIKTVDTEGTAIGQSSLKTDAAKVGGAAGAGLITGAVIGGPVGAAVGAGIGTAFGVGAVVIERGKHVRLNRSQQIRIKTAYETRIR